MFRLGHIFKFATINHFTSFKEKHNDQLQRLKTNLYGKGRVLDLANPGITNKLWTFQGCLLILVFPPSLFVCDLSLSREKLLVLVLNVFILLFSPFSFPIGILWLSLRVGPASYCASPTCHGSIEPYLRSVLTPWRCSAGLARESLVLF